MKVEGETFRLLQPGLMSIDELKEIISQRGVSIKSNANKSKYDLVELYEKMLMPLSQRAFPSSHQGKLINKKIIEEDKKLARNEPKSCIEFQFGFKDKPSGGSLKRHISHQSSSSRSSSDRLKPPIDSSSVSPKKICLSRKSSSDQELDKIVIKDRSQRNSDSSSDDCGKGHSRKADKREADKISVKSHSPTKKESKEKDKEEKNPKRKKIAWP